MFAFVKVSLQSKNDILYCLYNQSIFIESMFILQFKLHCEEFQNSHLKKLRIWCVCVYIYIYIYIYIDWYLPICPPQYLWWSRY